MPDIHLAEAKPEGEGNARARREEITTKIRTGIEELERGEGVPEDELDDHLARLKSSPDSF